MHFSQIGQQRTIQDHYGENPNTKTVSDHLAASNQRSTYSHGVGNTNNDQFFFQDVLQFLGLKDQQVSNGTQEEDELSLDGNPFSRA